MFHCNKTINKRFTIKTNWAMTDKTSSNEEPMGRFGRQQDTRPGGTCCCGYPRSVTPNAKMSEGRLFLFWFIFEKQTCSFKIPSNHYTSKHALPQARSKNEAADSAWHDVRDTHVRLLPMMALDVYTKLLASREAQSEVAFPT